MTEPYFIQCPCRRGYLTSLFISDEGVPIAFFLKDGYLIIQGWCDECVQLIVFSVSLVDLTFERAPNWTSAQTRKL